MGSLSEINDALQRWLRVWRVDRDQLFPISTCFVGMLPWAASSCLSAVARSQGGRGARNQSFVKGALCSFRNGPNVALCAEEPCSLLGEHLPRMWEQGENCPQAKPSTI